MRVLPRALGLVLVAAWVGLLLFVRLGDPFGDRGMSNVATGLLLLLALLAALVRFALARRVPGRRRAAAIGAVVALGAFAFALLRVEGVSGEMIPELSWRWSERAAPAPTPPGSGLAVALAPATEADFPGFLGPRRDNSVPGARLARDWNVRPARRLWSRPIGAGWSAFAAVNGWAVTMEQDGTAQRVSARSVATGELAWSVAVDEPFDHPLGGAGPRATPQIDGGRVYALGAWGKLVCLDGARGELVWRHDLLAEHGLTREQEVESAQYGRSSSPLVAGGLVIVPAGGAGEARAGLVAFDALTGEERWRSPSRHFSYSSPALATLAGIEQVLVVNEDTLSGHALADGHLVWEQPWPGRTSANASVSQPVPVPPERVLVSKGYGGGALLLALEPRAEGGLAAREVWRDARILRTKLTNVVIHAGHVYGLDDGMLECVALATGEKRWKEGRYGHGQVLLAGALLLVQSEEGEVVLVDPSPERANDVLGRFQAIEGKSWAHLCLSGNVLLVRNSEECAAWELPLVP